MTRALTLVVVAACLTALAIVTDFHNDTVFFTLIILPWAIVARVPGASLGALIGSTARHAVGWLAAFLTAGATVLLVSYIVRPERFVQDYGDGLGAAAWMYSLPAATIAELFWGIYEAGRATRRAAGE